MKADPAGVLTGVHYLDGDYACGEGAMAAGCRFVGGYPITHDVNSYPPNDRSSFAADGVLNTMNEKIMSSVRNYWGVGLVIAGLVGIGYYLGRKK